MAFNDNTRAQFQQLNPLTKPAGGGDVSFIIPKTGLLARLWLNITGAVAGAGAPLNPLGKSSIVKRVRLAINTGLVVFDVSGPGYHWILRDLLESEYIDCLGQTDARSAVAVAPFDISMVVPIMMNLRDAVGLVMLQNEQTQVTCTITFEADGNVGAGAVVTATVIPTMEYLTVPPSPADWPKVDVAHSILEETRAISATGQTVYEWPRGNTYLQIAHGFGIGVAGADAFDAFSMRINQSMYYEQVNPAFLSMQHYYYRGRARPAGVAALDFLATTGLGNYGMSRDIFDSTKVTDLSTVFNTTVAPTTLYTIRRQLVPLRPA